MSVLQTFTRSRRTFIIGIALLTVFSFGLRVFRLANQSFWIDEIGSAMTAQGPLKGIYERSILAANSLPTFFLMLKPFVAGAGPDIEFRARLLSVFAGTLSVPIFIGVVHAWRRQRGTALLAGALLAVNPLHLWYSQEARGYAVMLLFGLLTLLFFELAREKRRPAWWVLYILAALMTLAVHRTGIIFSAACGLWHLWDFAKRRRDGKTLLWHLPVAAAIAVALTLKSLPPGEGYGRSANGMEIGYTFLTFVGGYSFGPSVTDIQSHGPLAAISRNAFETGILVLVLLVLALVFVLNFRRLILSKEIQLLVLSIGVVSVYALLSGFPYNVRYALPALFGFLALAAVFATDFGKPSFARLSVAGLLLVSLWADGQWFYGWQYRKGDSRAVANWLVQNREHIHSWTVLPSYTDISIGWYLQNHPDILKRELLPTSDHSTSFPPVPDVLIITRRHHLPDADKVIADYESIAHGAETNQDFAAFELYIAHQNTTPSEGK